MRAKVFGTAFMAAALFTICAPLSASAVTYGPRAPDARSDSTLSGSYKPKVAKKTKSIEPLRGPWRVTKSLKNKGKEPVDESGNVYACTDQACKVSRKVDEKRD
jgi:hypothetical protein